MARHETTGARLAAGGRLPVLVLRRSGDDAELACEHLQHSQRLDVTVVRPADLVRTPLRWPSDARVVPLALCVVFHDRPTTAASARQLVDHVGEVPVIAVLDAPAEAERTAELAAELVDAGVGDVVVLENLTGPIMEQILLGAIDRGVRSVVDLGDALSVSQTTAVPRKVGPLTA